MKIAILTSTIRDGRNSIKVANWVLENKTKYNLEATFELVDLKDYKLPLFGGEATNLELSVVGAWQEKMNEFDAYIIVTAEYNHSFSGSLKNALDFLKAELKEKVVSFVGYGGVGGARAIEQLKLVLSTYSAITTGVSVNFFLNTDFINYSELNAQSFHVDALNSLLDETIRWGLAFKNLRK